MKLSTRSCLVALLVSSAQAYNVETHKNNLLPSVVRVQLSHENADLYAAQAKIFSTGHVLHSKIGEIQLADQNIFERIHRRDTTGELQDHSADFTKVSEALNEIGSARTEINNECSLVASLAKERDPERLNAEANAICKSMQDVVKKSTSIHQGIKDMAELIGEHERWEELSENRINCAFVLEKKAVAQAEVYNALSQLCALKASLCRGEPVSNKLRNSIESFKTIVGDGYSTVQEMGNYAENYDAEIFGGASE